MAIFSVSYTEFGHGQVSETGSNNILLRTRRKIGYRNISQEGLIWFCIGLSSPIMNKEEKIDSKGMKAEKILLQPPTVNHIPEVGEKVSIQTESAKLVKIRI